MSDDVFACDVAPAFVEQTLARVPRATVTCSDLRTYAIPPRIDLAYLGGVLTYLSDGDALDLLHRVRASATMGAIVVVRDWCTFNLGRRAERPDSRYYSVHRRPGEVRDLAIAAGFDCLELASSPRMYAEVMAGHRWLLGLPLRGLWRLATSYWMRASHTLILRA